MVFWIYMFIISMLLPSVMIGFGRHFYRQAPDKINYSFGYRTKMSMKNKDTWAFAHKYIGKLWFRLGIIMGLLSAIIMLILLFALEKDVMTVGIYGGIIVAVQIVASIFSAVPAEISLKKNFDCIGNRKHP